jgi:hypothetical protein
MKEMTASVASRGSWLMVAATSSRTMGLILGSMGKVRLRMSSMGALSKLGCGGFGAGAEAGDVEAVDFGDEFFEAFIEVGAIDGIGFGVEDEVEGLVEEFAGAGEVTGLIKFTPLVKHAFGAAHALVLARGFGGKGLAEERGTTAATAEDSRGLPSSTSAAAARAAKERGWA